MKRRERPNPEPTRIVWKESYGTYMCEKCGKVMHYQFDFRLCPYCGRLITHTDERRISL